MTVRPAYGFPVRRQPLVSKGLSSSFAALLANREVQKAAGTQISSKDIKIANDAKRAGVSVPAPAPVVSSPVATPVTPVVVNIPGTGIAVSIPAPVVASVPSSEAPAK